MVKMVTIIQTMVTWTSVRQWKANLHFPEVKQDNTELPTVSSRKETRPQAWWTHWRRYTQCLHSLWMGSYGYSRVRVCRSTRSFSVQYVSLEMFTLRLLCVILYINAD